MLPMQNELLETLTKFHRDVLLPDVKREVGNLRDEMVARFDGINSHFDSIYARFGRLETGIPGPDRIGHANRSAS